MWFPAPGYLSRLKYYLSFFDFFFRIFIFFREWSPEFSLGLTNT